MKFTDSTNDNNIGYRILSFNPSQISNNELVTVKYQSYNPSKLDWIGVFVAEEGPEKSFPVQYGFCESSDMSYLTSGSGIMIFNLTHLRSDLSLYYFTNGTEYPILMASSDTRISFKPLDLPLRSRTVTNAYNGFDLLWSSYNSSSPQLRWGISSNEYHFISNATKSYLNRDLLCGKPANGTGYHDMGQINTASLYDLHLISADRIYYMYGDVATQLWSDEYIFYVPPAKGLQPKHRSTQVALLADLGVGSSYAAQHTYVWDEEGTPSVNTSMSIGHLASTGYIDAMFIGGDIAYANGRLTTWEFFLNMISPITRHVVTLTIVGNHESDWPGSSSIQYVKNPTASGGECGVVSSTLLPMPYPATNDAPWWSYDVGLIHFVGMSTEHDYSIGSSQYQFLEYDLQHVDRSITPWVVFASHRPVYVDSNECCAYGTDMTVMSSLQQHIEPLLYRYQANLAFAGHYHDYQRLSAIHHDQLIQPASYVHDSDGHYIAMHYHPQATVYMVIGSAGNGPSYPSAFYPWSEANYSNVFGYAIITAENASHLHWKYIESKSNCIIDRMTIIQDIDDVWASLTRNVISGSVNSDGSHIGIYFIVVLFIILISNIIWKLSMKVKLEQRILDDARSQLLAQNQINDNRYINESKSMDHIELSSHTSYGSTSIL